MMWIFFPAHPRCFQGNATMFSNRSNQIEYATRGSPSRRNGYGEKRFLQRPLENSPALSQTLSEASRNGKQMRKGASPVHKGGIQIRPASLPGGSARRSWNTFRIRPSSIGRENAANGRLRAKSRLEKRPPC